MTPRERWNHHLESAALGYHPGARRQRVHRTTCGRSCERRRHLFWTSCSFVEALRLTTEFCSTPPAENEWRALAGAAAPEMRFMVSAWYSAWAKCFLPHHGWHGPLRYLSARDSDGRLRAVVPLATQRQCGVSVSAVGGLYWPFRSPLIAMIDAQAACDALAEALTRTRSLVGLRCGPVPDTNAAVARLGDALGKQDWCVHRSRLGTAYAVDLPGTWDEFEQRLGKSLRTSMKYYERKMAREGTLEIRSCKGLRDPGWRSVLGDLATIERGSWQFKEHGTLRFNGERNIAFWTSLLVDGEFGDSAIAWVMYFDSRPVSFSFCIDCGDTRHVLANNYAEDVRGYSTGTVLYKHVFRDAIGSGAIRRIDIGMGDSGYKSRWGALPAFSLEDWIAFRPGLRGSALDVAWRARRSIGERRAARRDADDSASGSEAPEPALARNR